LCEFRDDKGVVAVVDDGESLAVELRGECGCDGDVDSAAEDVIAEVIVGGVRLPGV